MQFSELVTDKDEFTRLSEECRVIFDLGQRLPHRVFRQEFHRYHAFEYDYIFYKTFAPFLVEVSFKFSDRAINYMTIEPDARFYFDNYGFYGLASFKPSELNDNYLKVMDRNGDVASFRARGGDVGIFWGSSLKWGIFCDRINWELCVMGIFGELGKSSFNSFKLMNSSQVKSYVANAYRLKPSVARDFADTFSKNYSIATNK